MAATMPSKMSQVIARRGNRSRQAVLPELRCESVGASASSG
jgi:hypothetical protein